MEIGTISRQTPQLRQDQLIRAAKTSVIEVLIVSRGETERELKIDHASGGEGGCSSSSRSVSCLIKQPQTIVLLRIH